MYILAKENPQSPEGWNYFMKLESVDSDKYPKTTLFLDNAKMFKTKEEAASAYWIVCRFFEGYKIYNYNIYSEGKTYGS